MRSCAPAADRGILARPALGNALLAHGRPAIFRPDNGAEYNAKAARAFLVSLNIAISRSKKGRHWENGYRESFYDKFKIDLAIPVRFSSLGEFVAEIYRQIHYDNNDRIRQRTASGRSCSWACRVPETGRLTKRLRHSSSKSLTRRSRSDRPRRRSWR